MAAPQLAPCASSGRAWRLWAAWHSQDEAQPQGAPPPPRVLGRAASKGRSPVTLPLTLQARCILYGERDGAVPTRAEAEVEAEVEHFVAAFGAQAAVYWGGGDALSEPALCVHARADLPGQQVTCLQ